MTSAIINNIIEGLRFHTVPIILLHRNMQQSFDSLIITNLISLCKCEQIQTKNRLQEKVSHRATVIFLDYYSSPLNLLMRRSPFKSLQICDYKRLKHSLWPGSLHVMSQANGFLCSYASFIDLSLLLSIFCVCLFIIVTSKYVV